MGWPIPGWPIPGGTLHVTHELIDTQIDEREGAQPERYGHRVRKNEGPSRPLHQRTRQAQRQNNVPPDHPGCNRPSLIRATAATCEIATTPLQIDADSRGIR